MNYHLFYSEYVFRKLRKRQYVKWLKERFYQRLKTSMLVLLWNLYSSVLVWYVEMLDKLFSNVLLRTDFSILLFCLFSYVLFSSIFPLF